MEKIKLTTTVHNCARCGESHIDLDFYTFSEESIYDTDGTIWNYWSLCPTKNEPILLKLLEENNGKN